MDKIPEGLSKATREYFYGKDEENTPEESVVAPELLVIPEDPEDLKNQIAKVKAELEDVLENKKIHDINLHKSIDRIEEDALPSEIKNADENATVLSKQVELLKQKLHEKTPPKSGIKGKLMSLLGLLP
ncbi:MAG: hypothetical protein KBC11_01995 [Candidatus Pacebacteria bacterium]|nr:hypothetical protein [Candidatus Paceibacterota bacterium]